MIDNDRCANHDSNNQQFEIRLGAGRNLYEIVQNIATVVPPGFEIYMGCDPQNVPAGILGDRNDLAIHVTSDLRMVQLSVKYFDSITGTYVGPITPKNFILTSDQEWGLWKDFSDIVIPHSSIITVLAAGCTCPCDGPGGGESSTVSIAVGTTTTVEPGQPARVTNVGTATNAVLNFEIPRGHDGKPGEDGYTPVKGKDYFTQEDKEELLKELSQAPIESVTPDKVVFDKDLLTSYAIGNIELVNGIGVMAKAGDTLADMLENVLIKECDPEVIKPSIEVTLNQSGSHEVGTYVSPTYTVSFDPGSYSFGGRNGSEIVNGTGVSLDSLTVTDTLGRSSTAADGSFDIIQVVDGIEYTVTAAGTHSDGYVPVTNLKNDYIDGKITAAKIVDTSGAVKGYRNTFYGTTETKDAITSDLIRSLNKSGKSLSNGSTITVQVPTGAVRVIVAYPATLRDITSIKDVNGLNAEISSGFARSIVKVSGAESYDEVDYKLYTMDFANANDKANTYTVVI